MALFGSDGHWVVGMRALCCQRCGALLWSNMSLREILVFISWSAFLMLHRPGLPGLPVHDTGLS